MFLIEIYSLQAKVFGPAQVQAGTNQFWLRLRPRPYAYSGSGSDLSTIHT